MTGLYHLNGTLITDHIKHALPRPDVIKVKSRTLNGSYDVEHIGTAARVLDLIVFTDEAGVDTINHADSIGEPLKVVYGGRHWIGIIDNITTWQEVAVRYFQATMTILVQSEGAVL